MQIGVFPKLLIYFFITIFSLLLVVSACKKDSCRNILCENDGVCIEGTCKCPTGYSGVHCELTCIGVNCNNGGVCIDGKCICPLGFEGADCNIQSCRKFIGKWIAKDTCNGGAYYYAVSIFQGPTITTLNIQYFATFPSTQYPIQVDIVDSLSLIIPQQVVDDVNYSGWGLMSSSHDQIRWGYVTSDGNTTTTCTATWARE